MTETLAALAAWLESLPPVGIVAAVFVIAYLENVLPPLPGDALVVVAGSVAALGVVSVWPVYAAAVAGSVLGFVTMLALGRTLGAAIYDPARLRWIPSGPLRTVERWFGRWGQGVVLANRFLSGGRAVIALLAGASRLPMGRTVAMATLSALAWCALLVGGGYALGAEFDRLLSFLARYGRLVTAVTLAVVAVGVARWWRARAGQETEKTPPSVSGEAPAVDPPGAVP